MYPQTACMSVPCLTHSRYSRIFIRRKAWNFATIYSLPRMKYSLTPSLCLTLSLSLYPSLSFFCGWVCRFVYTHIWLCVYMEAKGHPWVPFLRHSSFLFVFEAHSSQCLITHQIVLVGCPVNSSCLCLPNAEIAGMAPRLHTHQNSGDGTHGCNARYLPSQTGYGGTCL